MASNSLDFLLNLRANTTGFDQGINGAKFAVNALVGAMAALGVGLGAKELIETADAYNVLAAKIKIATDGGGNFAEAMTGVQRVAIATNTSLDATGVLFTKVNDIGKQMGLTQQQTLGLTETINKAMQLGGGSAQASEAAVTQLAQALQSGVLRGDEFNSIMEQAPGISKILAQELGVTTGELRKMAENGELTARRVVKAFQNQSDAVAAEYAKMPLTVGNALQKISTAWTVLVGELDTQAGNATGAIAQVLASLADNMDIVKVIFNDVMDGVEAIGERFNGLADDGTILALKNAIGALYDTFKTLVSTAFDLGKTLDDVFGVIVKNVAGTLGSFFGIVQDGDSDLNLINTTLNGISIALGLVSDATKGAKILIEFLGGAFLGLAGYVNKAFGEIIDFIPFMGSVAEQAKINGERLIAEGKKLIGQANDDAMAFESESKKRLERSVESSEQASARILAEKRKALDDTLALQSNEELGNAKLQAQKLAAVQTYVNDAVKANNGILDKNLQLELAQKGYFATVDQGGKVVVSTLTAQEQAIAAATIKTKQQEEAFRSASTVGQKFGIDVAAETNKVSKEFIQTKSSLIDFADSLKDAGVTGSQSADMIYQAWQKWMSQAKNTAEIDEGTKKLIEMGATGQITGEQLSAGLKLADAAAKDLNPSLNAAREAGKSLGVDIDKTANIMSQGFGQGSANLDTLKQKLEEAGITGREASNTLYQGWETWLKKADSQVELDAAKAKLKEFEAQGVFSTRQVENGMLALDIQTGKVKETTDEVTEAFKRLGIQTKDQLALQAKQALMDFDTVRNSGQATQADLQKAYQKTIDLAYASGNASTIASANSKAASLGLQVQIDATGKASVKSMDELSNSVENVGRTASGVAAQGFRELGRVAKQEAEDVAETWEQAMARIDKERKAQAAETAKGLGQLADGQNQMAQNFYDQLIAGGMEKGRAEELKNEAITRMNNQLRTALNGGSASGAFDAKIGRNESQAWMQEILDGLDSKGSIGSPSPKISAPNIEAPSIQQIKMPNIDIGSPKNVRIELVNGNNSTTVYGDEQEADFTEKFFRELEQAKKRM